MRAPKYALGTGTGLTGTVEGDGFKRPSATAKAAARNLSLNGDIKRWLVFIWFLMSERG